MAMAERALRSRSIRELLHDVEGQVNENRQNWESGETSVKDLRRLFDQQSAEMNQAIFNDQHNKVHDSCLKIDDGRRHQRRYSALHLPLKFSDLAYGFDLRENIQAAVSMMCGTYPKENDTPGCIRKSGRGSCQRNPLFP